MNRFFSNKVCWKRKILILLCTFFHHQITPREPRRNNKSVTLGFSPNIPLQESLVAYKIPFFAGAKTSARATPSRIFHLIRRIFTHVFFSSESTVPRAFADRFVRVKSIYYLVPGIFVFAETLCMVCCIVSVWKI
jgi:hypothetical protein